MIPGSNILNMALSVIARTPFQYIAFASRSTSTNGQYIAVYNAPLNLTGSAQPVPRNKYEEMGLDFQRTYYNFYVSHNVIDIQRDVSGDKVILQGNTFQCVSVTPWYGIDGWVAVLAVQIPNGS